MPRKSPAAERGRENTPLLFLLLFLIPCFGGYYQFLALLSGAVLIPLLLYELRRAGGKLRLPLGWEAVGLYVLCAAHLLAVPFAVSRGMAFAGFLRTGVWVLFFLYAATYTAGERRGILDTVAYEGAILSLLTVVLFLYRNFTGVADANGRIDGPFQYANAWSLYLMVCLVLLLMKERRRWVDWPAMAALLIGVYLSGSRGVFLLLLAFAAGYGVWYLLRRRRILPLALVLLGAAALLGAAILFSDGLVLRRIQAITLSSSSLNGRLLYYLDGLRMIRDHPMGVGRGGYLYLQPLYQTGVYTLRFIHNEYLQAALDGGMLGGLAMVVMMGGLLLRRGVPPRERVAAMVIAAHALIDFDFQFTALVFLLLLCGSGGACRDVRVPRGAGWAVGGVLTLVLCWFSGAYFLNFAGRPVQAWQMFPQELTLAEDRLQHCGDMTEAEGVADRILASTDLSMLAWDCKYTAATQRMDGPAMAESKWQYLRLNKYRGEVYEDFTQLLENLSASASQGELQVYQSLAGQALDQLETVTAQTSPLAYRIVDRPELEFVPEIRARLERIAQF